MSTTTATPAPLDLPRLRRLSLLVGVAGLIISLLGAVLNQGRFFQSYLVAYCYTLGLGVGSLAVLLLQFLTGGGWGLVLRRPLEAATRTLPLLAVLFLPLIAGLHLLYPWTEPGSVPEYKSAYYLNIPFFLVRIAIAFAIWIGLALVLGQMSRREDAEGVSEARERQFRLLGAPGMVLYGLTITFVSIDLGMSLEPEWFSTMYPPLWGFSQILTAFAFMIVMLVLLADRPPLSGVLNRDLLGDLGSLLLAFVMIWAYLAFSQFLLIWTGNLKEETPWYLERIAGGWQYFAMALILFGFAVPFLALLSGEFKRDGRTLACIAALVLGMRYLDTYWILKPAFKSEGSNPLWVWLDLGTLAAVAGFWLAYFLWQLEQMPLLPPHDSRMQEITPHG
jgi:hypothetical protein